MKHFTVGRVGLALLATAVVCLSQAAVASAEAPPSLSWSSSSGSFDYGTVQPGQTPSLTFTLTNSGRSATSELTISLPNPSPFSITSDTCTRTSLGPEKKCRVTVKYTPATSSDSAVLTASSKKGSASATLTGSKAEPQLGWSSSSGSFDYGTVQPGRTPSLTFTLTNSGSSDTDALTVSLPSPSPFSITSDTCTGTSLAPGKSCTVIVQYTPATRRDSAVLTASSANASASATLTGRKEPQSEIDCQSFGGTFTLVNSPDILWTCNAWTANSLDDFLDKTHALDAACKADGAAFVSSESKGDYPTTNTHATCRK